MILSHPPVLEIYGSEKEARVRFVKYSDYSLGIEIFVYVDMVTLPDVLAAQEEILLQINDIIQETGTGFAFPSQTTYLAQDNSLPKESIDQF